MCLFYNFCFAGVTQFQSYSSPDYSIGVKHNQPWLSKTSKLRFKIISPGLAGKSGTISLGLSDRPDVYLTRSGNSLLFRGKPTRRSEEEAATFYLHENLWYPNTVALQPFDPGRKAFYVSHKKFRVHLLRFQNSEAFKKDGSFSKFNIFFIFCSTDKCIC